MPLTGQLFQKGGERVGKNKDKVKCKGKGGTTFVVETDGELDLEKGCTE